MESKTYILTMNTKNCLCISFLSIFTVKMGHQGLWWVMWMVVVMVSEIVSEVEQQLEVV